MAATVPLDLLVLTDLSGALAFWEASSWAASGPLDTFRCQFGRTKQFYG